jgi:uncharacterized protein (TIGR00730 family)
VIRPPVIRPPVIRPPVIRPPVIRAVAVFCGSRPGNDSSYAETARVLGQGLAKAGIVVIYGGGRVGLMGVVADAAIAAGGRVEGVIPDFLLKWEVAHTGLGALEVTDGMHSRKRRMFELADAFVTLPGGIGTLDETIEVLSWRQLKLHDKPILICDVGGSWAPLVAAIAATVSQGFAGEEVRGFIEVFDSAEAVLVRLAA